VDAGSLRESVVDLVIKDFNVHRSRHDYAMRWLADGGSLAQELLGHAHISTTMRYARMEREASVFSRAARGPDRAHSVHHMSTAPVALFRRRAQLVAGVGDPCWDRTSDSLLKRQVLYRLS